MRKHAMAGSNWTIGLAKNFRAPAAAILMMAAYVAVVAAWMTHSLDTAHAQEATPTATPAAAVSRPDAVRVAGNRLLRAYPSQLLAIDGNDLIWRDGTRMPLDDGAAVKSRADWLARPDLKDMFRDPYPAGAQLTAPQLNDDPGRARTAAFFTKMYGDCRTDAVARDLVDVAWLPQRTSQKLKLKLTRRNGVDAKLAAVVAELGALPTSYDRFLLPPAGTYNCRAVAGTTQSSAHGYGIAIDIAIKPAHYWRWSKADGAGHPVWRNDIPMEIVSSFERHGFIWGGRWSHYDTMHFEYRPELLLP